MKRIVALGPLGVAGWLLAATAALAITGIANGSFETTSPAVTVGWWSFYPGNTTGTVQGWTVASGSVDVYSDAPSGWQASAGHHSVDLDGNSPGAIQQTLTTTDGTFYTVKFDLSGNPDPDTVVPPGWNRLKRVQVTADGGNAQVFSYDILAKGNTHTNMKYETHQYVFKATGTTTTLRFQSLSTAGWWGPVLDNVRVSEFTKDSCKKDGWMTLVDSAGHSFKNQGDCVSFVATGGKNLGAGQ